MGEIRKLTENEMEQSLKLSEFAFQYLLTDEEKRHKLKISNPEHTVGYFEENELLAKMTVLPLAVTVADTSFEMAGIAGVATYPEHRRKGLVKSLLYEGLQELRQKQIPLAFLFPFSIAFYRKYGWELFCDQHILTLTKEQLPNVKMDKGKMVRVSQTEYKPLAEIYEQYALRYNGMLVRKDEWWTNWLFMRKNGNISIYYDENNKPQGYIIYEVKDRVMTVHELVYLDHSSRIGLWAFIKNHDSMVSKVVCEIQSDDVLPYWLENPKVNQEIIPYFMARIVDVELFLKQYPFERGDDDILFLHLQDEYTTWNQAIYQITFSSSGTHDVKKYPVIEKGSCQHAPKKGIRLEIGTLTTMLLNYKKANDLLEIGKIRGEREEVKKWEERIPKKRPSFIDFF
ncbi:GNAT family N-acetyltransferase [Bacillus alkalicellulosilyticus]|uniref:GNAT family N-acetyltransferase n=1 Tax=Alkalihalobacterium alkalicellulosilyticum TaxID=1912214 RepID=UPI0014834729|nr:GNAT family N-acetyltransferase [Bacillus alkalicellulosilyticus]